LRQFIIAAVTALTLLCVLSTPSVANAAPAVDNSGIYICENNSPEVQSCLDLKNDNFSANQQIYIWSNAPAEGGTGLGWNLAQQGTVCGGGKCGSPGPFNSGSGLNTRYNGQPIYYIEKTDSSGHNGCAGFDDGLVAWEPCGADATRWIASADDYFINVYYSNEGNQPMAMTGLGTGNGSAVVIETLNSGGYQQWTWGPGA
jgi:hypothetical protein